MKLTTNTKSLVSALAHLRSVIPSRATLPILGNIRIEANGSLRVAANNLNQSLEVTMDAEISDKGKFTLPGHSLHAALSCMDGATVLLSKEKGAVSITCGSRTAKMQGLPSEEFPPISKPKGGGVTIPGEKLKRWLACCIPCASVEPTRYNLNGVHVTSRDGNICMEATDGYRLIIIESDVPGKLSHSIIPNMGAKVLAGLVGDGDVTISEDGNTIFATGADWEFATRKIEGLFPEAKRLIPSDRPHKIAAVRESLMDAIRYASLFAGDGLGSIRFASTPGHLTVSAASETQDGATQIDGFPKNSAITFAVNPSYMLDLLRCFDSEEVALELVDACAPITIQQGETTAIVMPLRIA